MVHLVLLNINEGQVTQKIIEQRERMPDVVPIPNELLDKLENSAFVGEPRSKSLGDCREGTQFSKVGERFCVSSISMDLYVAEKYTIEIPELHRIVGGTGNHHSVCGMTHNGPDHVIMRLDGTLSIK